MRIRAGWLAALAALAAVYFLYFFGLTGMGLIGPDEPRYAWVGREMARSGDWVTPRLWGQPWFEKPALLYWMTAAGFRLGLGEDLAPRLPVACLSVLFLAFFYWRMRQEWGAAAAGYGTAVLATSAGWVAYSHAAVVDLPLTAALAAAMLCLQASIERRDARWLAGFGALLGLATLAKGLVAPALAGLTVAACAVRMGGSLLRDLWRPAPWLAFAAVAGPWYGLCYARNGAAFLDEFFWKHHVSRFVSGALDHRQPVWFFLPVLAGALLPWTPLAARLARGGAWREPRGFFLLAWSLTTLAFFSLSTDKLPGYILPALPALAALAGLALASPTPVAGTLGLCAATLGLLPVAETILPAALETGLSRAWAEARFTAPALVGAAALVAAAWRLERARRRGLAVAAIALSAAASYALMKARTFPAIDRRAGTRAQWEQAGSRRDSVCLGQVRRHVAYGLNYYAGRQLPDCDGQPGAYAIEDPPP